MPNRKKNKNKNKNRDRNSKEKQLQQKQYSPPPPLPLDNFKASILMESDWHIGLGAGIPGNIDRLVQRDADEIPGNISAKTLTGVWRDACEAIALGLDNGKEGAWSKYVIYLFGDQPALNPDSTKVTKPPIKAALKVRPAKIHQDIRNAILNCPKAERKALIKAITFSKPGIRINTNTGCAEEESLRTIEMVRAGTYLTSECQLDTSELGEKQIRAAWALLIAGARYLERLGGKRRRGAGKCLLNLAEIEEIDTWLNWIETETEKHKNSKSSFPANPFPEKKQEEGEKSQANNSQKLELTANPNQESTWYKISLTITTKLPVIIKARTVGNVVETLDYIPGGRLLPIVAKQLGKMGINIIEAIATKQLVVTNATIKVGESAGRPVPLALFYEKMSGGFDKGQVYNKLTENPPKDKQLKGYRQGYISQIVQQDDNFQLPDYATVNTVIQTHNTIDDDSQRPESDIGGVYTYQAVEPGTVLQAEVRIAKSICDRLNKKNPNWWQKLQGKENIGTSKKDDYGLVEIALSNPIKVSLQDAKDAEDIKDATDKQLIVWLLSDTLIRDRQLRPSVSLHDLTDTLQQALNKDASDDKKITLSLKANSQFPQENLSSAYVRQRRTESWQKRWGLPRPSLVGLMAGSCIEFEIDSNLEPAELNRRLENLAIVGIGERTAEGYGQISLNAPILKKKTSSMKANSQPNPSAETESISNSSNSKIAKDKDSFSYARLIETQAWRSAIRNAAIVLASDAATRKGLLGIRLNSDCTEGYPSMSQLSNLRSLIGRLQTSEDINLIRGWIKSTKEKRAKKWEQTNDALDKIQSLVTSNTIIWDELKQALKKDTEISLKELTLTQETAALREELRYEAIRTVIYECIRAHKRELEPAEQLITEPANQ